MTSKEVGPVIKDRATLLGELIDDFRRSHNLSPALNAELAAFLKTAEQTEEHKAVLTRPSVELMSALSVEESGMLAYRASLPGGETRILRIPSRESILHKNIVVATRFVGNTRAMRPVIDLLLKDEYPPHFTMITDRKTHTEFEKYANLQDITPKDQEFTRIEHQKIAGTIDVVFLDPASGDGFNVLMMSKFLEGPQPRPKFMVVHDAHASTERMYEWLQRWDMPFPDKICVIDQWQRERLAKTFPGLENKIVVTGQPMFDQLGSPEFVAESRAKVRQALGLTDNHIFIPLTLMAESFPGEVNGMAEALSRVKPELRDRGVITVRKHPDPRKDPTPYGEYVRMFTDRGLNVVHTMDGSTKFSTDAVIAAGNAVLNTLSTGGFAATNSGIPAIHVVDGRHGIKSREDILFDVPAAELGAAIKLDDAADLTKTMENLFGLDPVLREQLKANMETYYPRDGLKAQRVVDAYNAIMQD